MYPRASSTLCALACAISLGLGSAGALARESRAASPLEREPRVLIVQGQARDWVRRVQGQLSDLPASIETAAAASQHHVALTRDELRARLEWLAAQRDAALVASIVQLGTPLGERTQVAIWFSGSELLYTRVLAEDWDRLSAADRSGALELAALSVRSAVRALTLDPAEIEAFVEPELESPALLGAATPERSDLQPSASAMSSEGVSSAAISAHAISPEGVSSEQASVAKVSVAAASADPLADPSVVVRSVMQPSSARVHDSVADTASASDTSAPLELRWSSELGMVGSMQGEPALGSVALQAGLGLASGAWGLSVLGQLGLPTTSSLGPAQVELQRYALLAEFGYSGWNAGAWQFGPLLRGGLTLTERETHSDSPALTASDSAWQGSLLLGAGWSSEYRWSERLGFFLRAVVDWQASPATYAVRTTTDEPVVSAEAWAVQPSVALGGNWHW